MRQGSELRLGVPVCRPMVKPNGPPDYDFSSKLLEHVIGPVFSKIANSFVDSFCSERRRFTLPEQDAIRVQVNYSSGNAVSLLDVVVPFGASVGRAIAASGIREKYPELSHIAYKTGVS